MGMALGFQNEWMNLTDFFYMLILFRKVKSYINSYWVGMVKYVCGLLGHATI